MPWKAFKVQNEFCVFRIDQSGKKFGNSLGCHASRKKANRQVAALNINEKSVKPSDRILPQAKRSGIENPTKTVGIPASPFGYTVADTFEKLSEKGSRYSKDEANYRQPASIADITCGSCRFYLRSPSGETGGCQVVEGPIPWFGTSDFYINARAEARATFAEQNAYADDERKRPKSNEPESKENTVTEETKETVDEKLMLPAGMEVTGPAMSFRDVDDMEVAMERQQEIQQSTSILKALVSNITNYGALEDQPSLLEKVIDGFRRRLSKTTQSVIKDMAITPFMVYKTNEDQYRFITTYSNNIRDDDNPPEIISAASHRRFVDLVDKGLAPLPALWLYHMKDLVIGQTDVVAFDDETGVAMAVGHFYDYAAPVAETISKNQDDWRVSHGMPTESIARNKDDRTIYDEHITKEISPLPCGKEANRWADFIALKEADMSLTPEKLAELEAHGISKQVLANIQANNAELSKQADDLELERKESNDPADVPVETPAAPVVETPVAAPVVETPAEVPLTETPAVEAPAVEPVVETPVTPVTPVEAPAEEVAPSEPVVPAVAPGEEVVETVPPAAPAFTEEQTKELTSVLTTIVENVMATVNKTLDEKLAPLLEVRDAKDDFISKAFDQTPKASWQDTVFNDVINGNAIKSQSALNQDETLVDGRSALSKDGPAETEEEKTIIQTGNPFSDMIASDIVSGDKLAPLREQEPA